MRGRESLEARRTCKRPNEFYTQDSWRRKLRLRKKASELGQMIADSGLNTEEMKAHVVLVVRCSGGAESRSLDSASLNDAT